MGAQCTKNVGAKAERKIIAQEHSVADEESEQVMASSREARRMLVLERKLKKEPGNSAVANELAELFYRNVSESERLTRLGIQRSSLNSNQ